MAGQDSSTALGVLQQPFCAEYRQCYLALLEAPDFAVLVTIFLVKSEHTRPSEGGQERICSQPILVEPYQKEQALFRHRMHNDDSFCPFYYSLHVNKSLFVRY